jgi:hypothetical protein
MRNCPGCQQPFVKTQGCNKMTCTRCGALSCYVCRKLVNSYDHFEQVRIQLLLSPRERPADAHQAPAYDRPRAGGKCPLTDEGMPLEQRHAAEVVAARDRAVAEFREANPDADPAEINVEAPVAEPARVVRGPGMGGGMGMGMGMHVLGMHRHMHAMAMGMPDMPGRAGMQGMGPAVPALGPRPFGGGPRPGAAFFLPHGAPPARAGNPLARMHHHIDALRDDLIHVQARGAHVPAPQPPWPALPPNPHRRVHIHAPGRLVQPPAPWAAVDAPAHAHAPPERGRRRVRIASPPPVLEFRPSPPPQGLDFRPSPPPFPAGIGPWDGDWAADLHDARPERAAVPPPRPPPAYAPPPVPVHAPAPPLVHDPLGPFHVVWAPGGAQPPGEPGGGHVADPGDGDGANQRVLDQEEEARQRVHLPLQMHRREAEAHRQHAMEQAQAHRQRVLDHQQRALYEAQVQAHHQRADAAGERVRRRG